jgi:ABC-2 type transport system permease protein
MNQRLQVWIIARREFTERSKSRVFRGVLIGLSLLIIGGIFAISLIIGQTDTTNLGIGGDSPQGLVDEIDSAADAVGSDVVVIEYTTKDGAIAAVESGEVQAVLLDGHTIVSESGPSRTVMSILSSAAHVAVRREIASDLGLSEADMLLILAPVQIDVIELEPAEPEEPNQEARAVASFASALVLLTMIMMFGQFVAMGIVEEKQNRIVEVILSRAKASSLLVGKVLGIGTLGLVQISVLGAAALIGLWLAPLPEVDGLDISSIGLTAVVWLIFWFILGYLMYSFMYATVGATISRQEDMQSVAFIPAISIMPAYLMMVFSIESGPGPLVRIASMVPLWSPILMPFRMNTGGAAAWEVALAVLLVILSITALVRIGSRVYRGAALRTGARVSLLDAWRSGRKALEAK